MRTGKQRIIADSAEIVRRNPDIIIGSWCGKKFRPENVAARAGWQAVNAVRNSQLFEIKSCDILQPGPAALTDRWHSCMPSSCAGWMLTDRGLAMTVSTIARSELILGGQKSGKSRRAEMLARTWLEQSIHHRAVLIATAQPWDDEMRERIVRHQADRAARVPGMTTVEEPYALAAALAQHSRADTLVVVDCLTLWLTNQLMPCDSDEPRLHPGRTAQRFAQAKEERAGTQAKC